MPMPPVHQTQPEPPNMRVLLLAPHPFYQLRGTPIDVELVVRALSERGATVDVATYHEGTDVDYPGVRICRIRAPRWLDGVRPGFSARKLLCDLLLFLRAWGLVARGDYDVVHAGEEAVFMAMFFKLFHGLPYVYDMDSSIAQQLVESRPLLGPLSPLFNYAERLAIRGALAVAPVCHALGDLARQRGGNNVVVLHDISQLADEDFRSSWSLRERLGVDGPLMLYVGNLERYQGVDLLLEGFGAAHPRRPDLRLVVAGGAPEDIDAYRRQAERLGVAECIHWLGWWPAEKLGELLGQADFLVAPRIRGINTPMKIFPYLHSGRPVLATRLPTHTQLLDDSVALLAPPTPADFAEAIVRLAGDAALRDRLGAAGRQFVLDNHLYTHYRQRLDRLYGLVGDALVARRPEAAACAER